MNVDFTEIPATTRTGSKPATFLKANEGEKGVSKKLKSQGQANCRQ